MQVGRYALLDELGRGGMGAVHRAVDPATGEPVAVKVLLVGRGVDEGARRRFLREVSALSGLQHPNVIRVRDAGEHAGVPYLVMDLIEGESVEARLRRGPASIAEAVVLARALAGALAYVHGRGLVHRDVKPSNLLVRRDGVAVLTDFGLVRDLDPGLSQSRLTKTGTFVGTPAYASPEALQGGEVGAPADVYGLGATLHALLTGRPPHPEATTLIELLDAIERGTPSPPSSTCPEVPRELDALCLRCLARDPADRPTAGQVETALGRLRRDPGRARRRRPDRRVPLLVALAAGAVGVAIGAAWVATRVPAPATQPPPPAPPVQAAVTEARPTGFDAEALLSLAGADWVRGDLDAGVVALDRALAGPLDPRLAVRVHVLRGLLVAAKGDGAAAWRDLDRAQELAPDEAERAFVEGVRHLRRSERQAAHEAFTRALGSRADHAYAWLLRGIARTELGDPAGAIEDYGRALELDADFVPALVNRAGAHRLRREFARAIADCTRVAELEPRSAVWLRNRALVRFDQGDLQGAIDDCTRAVELDPGHAPAYYHRGLARGARGDHQGAIDDCTRSLELQPRDARALLARADAKGDLDQLAAAFEDYARAIEVEPTYAPAHHNRGQLRAKQRDWAGALRDYDRAIELGGERYPVAHLNRGIARHQTGDHQGAIDDYTRTLELDARQALAYLNRGLARSDLGDRPGALADWERFVELAPQHPQAPAARDAIARARAAPP